MCVRGFEDRDRIRRQGRELKARFKAYLAGFLVDPLVTAAQILPIGVAVLEPVDRSRCTDRALLDAAMARIGRCVNGAVYGQLRVGKENFDILMEGALIALAGKHVICFFGGDGCGDGFLCAHRVNRSNRALNRQHLQELGDYLDFVAFPVHRALRDH